MIMAITITTVYCWRRRDRTSRTIRVRMPPTVRPNRHARGKLPGRPDWTTKAKQDAVSADVDSVIAQDVADVKAANVTGTPTFFVNGKPLASFGPQPLMNLVKSEVETTS
ncbi:DsbA family protein [Ensifer sp. P24N7]|uniref:DsbA family protein n=1 Tax=Sinorhizobium sp. P24N7 TaxID=3348358 RepID=UPI0035F229F2